MGNERGGVLWRPQEAELQSVEAAGALGPAMAISCYRAMERVGHMAGHIIAAQLSIWSVNSPFVVSWIGAATLLFVLVYILPPGGKSATSN